jgi:hypothetical protein
VFTICTARFNIQQFHVLPNHKVYLCVLYGSQNKQRLFPYTALTDWFYSRNLTLYSPLVTICTASLTFNNSTFCPHSVFMCFVWIWEQTAFISLYNINWVFIIIQVNICLQRTKSSLALISRCLLSVHGLPLQLLWPSWRCRRYSLPNVGRTWTLPPLKADVRTYTGFPFSRKRNLMSVTA